MLIRIAVGFFGVVIVAAAMFCLFGIVQPFRPQGTANAKVIGMEIEYYPNTQHITVFTIQFETDDGIFIDTVKGKNNIYSPFESFKVRYFKDDHKINHSYTGGWIAFAIMLPLGVATFLVAIFAMGKSPKTDDEKDGDEL